jgi:hypothetical protein
MTPVVTLSCGYCLLRPTNVSEGTGVNTNRLILKKYLVAASLMLAGVALTSYDAGANARRGGPQNDARMGGVAPAERDSVSAIATSHSRP